MAKGNRGGKRNAENWAEQVHQASVKKIAQERELINDIIRSQLRAEEYADPNEIPLSRGDIQGMVEAFAAQHGYTFDEEETLQDRLDLESASAMADYYELKGLTRRIRDLEAVIRKTPRSRANEQRREQLRDLDREWHRINNRLSKYNYLDEEELPF